ncbi:hypothetical protein ACJJTC_013819 [Scirpophaga incertulas]
MANKLHIEPVVLAPEISPINNIINISIPFTKEYIPEDFQHSFQNIDKQIKQSNKNSKQIEEEIDNSIGFHDIHHYVAIYSVIAVIIAVAIFAYVRAKCRRRRSIAVRQYSTSEKAVKGAIQPKQCGSECVESDQCVSECPKAESSPGACTEQPYNNRFTLSAFTLHRIICIVVSFRNDPVHVIPPRIATVYHHQHLRCTASTETMHLNVAMQHLDAFTNWLDNYRENGFQSSLLTAREIAEENNIDRQFKEVRRQRKKRHFDYEGEDEALELNAEEMFKINYFYVIVDTVRESCRPRFEALKQHESIFGFMYRESGGIADAG